MRRERYDDFLHIDVDGDPPRCRVIWEAFLDRHNPQTPEGGCELDRDLEGLPRHNRCQGPESALPKLLPAHGCCTARRVVNRAAILEEAARLVCTDRDEQHGDARESFGRIAALWSADLGIPIGPADVARLMALLKLARAKGKPGVIDSWIDAAGYSALAGELAE